VARRLRKTQPMSDHEHDGALDDGVAIIDRMAATGRLAAACTHDLLGLLDVIYEGTRELSHVMTASPDNHERLDRIRDATSRVGEITRMLIQLGRGPAATTDVELTSLVDDLRRVLNQLIARRGRLAIIRRGGELRVAADRRAVEQALFNLVALTIDCAGDGRVTVETGVVDWSGGMVALDDVLPAGRYATLAVSGEGGAPTCVLGDVVDPCAANADQSSLRLALVVRIARGCGGGVLIDVSAAGSQVTMLLPLLMT
jgi:signal transduction histidine kinase